MTQDERWLVKCQEAIDFLGSQPPQTLQVRPARTQTTLLVEEQQEVDECRRVEAEAGEDV